MNLTEKVWGSILICYYCTKDREPLHYFSIIILHVCGIHMFSDILNS